jgi:multicomponent Na+:H+ antiporter subunit C
VDELISQIISKLNYWVYIVLMMIGLYAIISKKNLVKKIIGMNILQTAVILFFISLGAKKDATIPIITHGTAGESHAVRAADFINPLPHVLMLTAIVVAVATLGVALALVVKVFQQYQTLEEDEILARLEDE